MLTNGDYKNVSLVHMAFQLKYKNIKLGSVYKFSTIYGIAFVPWCTR